MFWTVLCLGCRATIIGKSIVLCQNYFVHCQVKLRSAYVLYKVSVCVALCRNYQKQIGVQYIVPRFRWDKLMEMYNIFSLGVTPVVCFVVRRLYPYVLHLAILRDA